MACSNVHGVHVHDVHPLMCMACLKQTLGFDLAQLNAAMGGSLLVAGAWVLAASLTGVVGDERYERGRVLLTWLLAAPVAGLLRVVLYDYVMRAC